MNRKRLSIALIMLLFFYFMSGPTQAFSLTEKLKGKILLQVEQNGEAWYVNPKNLQRYYLGKPVDAFNIMKKFGLGISENDFSKLNGYGLKSMRGKILLRVQSYGEAYYVDADSLKLYYLNRPADAFEIMRNRGLGITNNDLALISQSTDSAVPPISQAKVKLNPVSVKTAAGTYHVLNYQPKLQKTPSKPIKIAVCMMQWADSISLPTVDYLNDYFSKVNDVYNEISLGHSYLNQVIIAYPKMDSNQNLPMLFYQEESLAKKWCDPLIDFSAIDLFAVFPSAVVGAGGASASYMQTLKTDEKEIESRILLGHYDANNGFINHLTTEQYGVNLFIHEMGHTKLLNHLNHDAALDCGTKSFGLNNCIAIEYGHRFSGMSNDSGHFSGWYKNLAGSWLSIKNINIDGTYSVTNLETSSAQTQLLRLTGASYPLCVEYRLPKGADEKFLTETMQKNGNPGGIPENGCLFISLCTDETNNFPFTTEKGEQEQVKNKNYLLDMTPNSQTTIAQDDFFDACLQAGQTFSDADMGVNISFSPNIKIQTADVQVNFVK